MARLWLSILFMSWAGITNAQQLVQNEDEALLNSGAPSVLTVDTDRLFTTSQFGIRVFEDYSNQVEALANENRSIADALREEEIALAEQRPEMAVAIFLSEAEAFDEKAQAIRRAQDAKERELETFLIDGRNRFLEVSLPILGDLMVERGAFAILDRRSVLLSLGSIDVTDDAIARINEILGDGTAPQQNPEQQPPLDQD